MTIDPITVPPDGSIRIRRNDELFDVIEDFYFEEAAILDANRLDDWLGLLAATVTYAMPVRTTTSRNDMPGFSSSTGFFEDNYGSLQTRVRRFTRSRNAWAEDPPSRTRRFVTNLRAGLRQDGCISASTNILIVRNRGEDPDFELFSAQRSDVLQLREVGALELASRLVLIDQAVVGAVNFSLFI